MAPPSQLITVIAGVGPGTGASIARRFAQTYPVVLLARTPASYEDLVKEINGSGGKAVGISTDVSDGGSVGRAMERVRGEFGEGVGVAAAIFNASGSFVRKPFLEMTEEEFMTGFDVSGRGAFLFSRALLPGLLSAVPSSTSSTTLTPTLIFTGATASYKGSAHMSAFSTGKFALRSLSQSLAREFGPKGVHVAHANIDGVIDIERTKGWMKDAGPDAKIRPDAIAEAYWNLHMQHRSALTNEIDIRPYVEKW
ncbi:NAD(P)-binding protein [Aulographum hederae CBS 113979]|uniref:NAD(P)-binding protein n=1 Tax=Aulographum hederae CBS 113979 TaxID=1176131 RepID=A0A6G1H7P3_9PEZI|nr:NAD(P)-binding protein [Aulographum hederae CBS 113979]